MSKKNQQNNSDQQLANVEESLVQSEMWLEKNRNTLLISLGVIVVVALAIFAIKHYWYEKRVSDAAQAMVTCQDYFAVDSFQVALDGDNVDCEGFLAIIDNYSMTPSAKLAKAYAGICYYHLGQYQEAVEMLEKASVKDINFAPAVKQLLGDCYVEMQQYDNAIDAYNKAVKMDNDMIAPMSLNKIGRVYEAQGNKDKAIEVYKQIKDNYPASMQAQEADKRIAALQ